MLYIRSSDVQHLSRPSRSKGASRLATPRRVPRLRVAASGGNEEMYVDTIGSRVRSSKRVGAGVSAALKRRVRQLCSGRADPPADERIRGLATDVAQKLDRGDPVEVITFDR
jgi:hypothetical protein